MRAPIVVHPGLELPVWTREGNLDSWNRFAAVNYEFAGHHMDDLVGKAEGFGGAFIMAPLSHAYLHCLLREWLGDECETRIVSIDMRLKSPLLRGRRLRAGGKVVAIHERGSEIVIDLEVWQADDEEAQLGKGLAVVAVERAAVSIEPAGASRAGPS